MISEPVSSFAVDPSLLTSDEALALQGALSEDLLARLAQAGDSQFMQRSLHVRGRADE